MFVKIYDKVINYIKKEYKFLLLLFLILFLGLFQLPYNIYMGGGLIDIENRIKIENSYEEKGSFNMTYVKSSRATIPIFLLSYLFNWERESIDDMKLDENDSFSDIWQRDLLYLKEANDNAIISAYTKAGETITIKKEVLEVLYIDKDSKWYCQLELEKEEEIKCETLDVSGIRDILWLPQNYQGNAIWKYMRSTDAISDAYECMKNVIEKVREYNKNKTHQ